MMGKIKMCFVYRWQKTIKIHLLEDQWSEKHKNLSPNQNDTLQKTIKTYLLEDQWSQKQIFLKETDRQTKMKR